MSKLTIIPCQREYMDLLFQKSRVMILVYETTTTTTFRRITVYEKSFSFISSSCSNALHIQRRS
ncbi:hypothetical protein PVN32_06550, partial [Bacillus paralicheniformis]